MGDLAEPCWGHRKEGSRLGITSCGYLCWSQILLQPQFRPLENLVKVDFVLLDTQALAGAPMLNGMFCEVLHSENFRFLD